MKFGEFMKTVKIDLRVFYLVGAILMFISFLANLYNLTILWGNLNVGGKISFIAGSLLFQLLLCSMFFWLWKVTPKSSMTIQDNPELDKFVEELSMAN